jgi:NADPH-dependent 2,4-dienoyl-CoA reductase/sulfur reductase-like enzyme
VAARPQAVKYLLVGGGLAAGQAAKQIRENGDLGSVCLVGDEPYVPYDRPPLTKEFMRGEKTADQLPFDPESFYRDHGIELRLGVAVQEMDGAARTVRLADGDVIAYEKALVATGGRPVRLKVPGTDRPGVHYLRTRDDASAIAADAVAGARAVVVGAGFIGLELAASLTQRGVKVSVVESAPRIWPRFADPTLAGFFHDYCTGKGIAFHTGEAVAEVRGQGRPSAVVTAGGRELPCDFVCVGVGIVPNVEIARQAGLAVEDGVLVNEFLQSSHPDVYAAGDVASYLDPVFGKRRRVEHWGHAEYSGQLAGRNMTGAREVYDLVTYVWSDVFDLHLEFAGDEREHERVLLRGTPESGAFTVLYLKGGALRAYFAVNGNADEFPALQQLIRSAMVLTGREARLQDPAVPISTS